jgi:hypothetical protein
MYEVSVYLTCSSYMCVTYQLFQDRRSDERPTPRKHMSQSVFLLAPKVLEEVGAELLIHSGRDTECRAEVNHVPFET